MEIILYLLYNFFHTLLLAVRGAKGICISYTMFHNVKGGDTMGTPLQEKKQKPGITAQFMRLYHFLEHAPAFRFLATTTFLITLLYSLLRIFEPELLRHGVDAIEYGNAEALMQTGVWALIFRGHLLRGNSSCIRIRNLLDHKNARRTTGQAVQQRCFPCAKPRLKSSVRQYYFKHRQ